MWPTPQDYNEAVQNPGLSFGDAELQACSTETNALGLPKPRSGSFASVYHLAGVSGDWAVRCFLHHFGDQEQRYAEIGRALKAAAVPHTVDFSFLSSGIRVRGNWYPVLKMQWISGEPLNEWISHNVNDVAKTEHLRDRFVAMCSQLQAVGIAHGDLQHGNILVVGDDLKLVDYDGMFVPALEGLRSNEIGHRNYQHPQRSREHFGDHLDRFAAWSIYTSLHCIAADPELWGRIGGGDEGLLFKLTDYKKPEESATFRLLEHHENVEIRRVTRALRKLLSLGMDELPPLGEPIAGLDTLPDLDSPERLPRWMINDADGAPPTVVERGVGQVLGNLAAAAAGSPPKAPKTVTLSHSAPTPALAIPTLSPPPAATPPPALPAAGARSSWSSGGSTGNLPAPPQSQLQPAARRPFRKAAVVTALIGLALISIGFALRTVPALWADIFKTGGKQSTALDTGNALYREGYRLQSRLEWTAAIAVYQQAMADYAAVRSEPGMAWSAYEIGRCYRGLHNDDQALAWMQKAYDRFRAGTYIKHIYTDLGQLYATKGNLTKACYYLAKSLEWNHRGDLETDAPMAKLLRRMALKQISDGHPDGLKAYRAAIEYDDLAHLNDPVTYFAELTTLASQLEKRHNLTLAVQVWRIAFDVSLNYPGKGFDERIKALRNLARIGLLQGDKEFATGCNDLIKHLQLRAAGKDPRSLYLKQQQQAGLPNPRMPAPPEKGN